MKALNLLLEIGTEELPASFIEPALQFLKESLYKKLEENYLSPSSIETAGTPKRLIVIAYDVPEVQPDREELLVGPSVKAAFDEEGNPTKAALGFARSKGASVEELIRVENPPGKTGEYVAIKRLVKGKPAAEILSKILPEIITSIPFKKSMRWGTKKLRFARPIRWITAVLGNQTVSFEIDGIKSSNVSYGHRFLSPEPFEVGEPAEFITQLEDRFVVADIEKRKSIIFDGIRTLAASVGGKVLKDEDLLDEVTNLVEYPYPILGSFEEEFLSLPPEVPTVVMKDHQKFFSVVDEEGKLKNYFIGVANIKPVDEVIIRIGYEKVLRARLSDALFFFNEDRKRKLEERVPDLKGIVFHEKLGTMLDKTKRLERLAPAVAERISGDRKKAERAAHICKADLLTEMVNEFTELQGTMGKYYALLDGEDEEVASAIEEHYLPRFSGDRVAETKIGISLSIAEKIDNLIGFIGAGFKPTGSADPFALRRNALGLIQTLIQREVSLSLLPLLSYAYDLYKEQNVELNQNAVEETISFIKDRLKGVLRENGFKPDTVEAVLPVTDDVYDIFLRAKAIDVLRESPEFEEVLITMRRVVNIIPKDFEPVEFTPEGRYEEELFNEFLSVREKLAELLQRKDYKEALLTVKTLKPYVDAFFDNVMVMDKDENVKNRRLSLLKTIADELLKIMDFSKIAI
ncbi:glycyl-tRNA synthetase beta chain [Desulfurobacterium pacificum]|uniref:Glycine--tRNA ligase beta subunit n=1 Tax=Desulfurobacterium pacificum TaxID=240166 RepID=A0ABY1NI42_9BACT|nr:glycine--tRNA ligase subunit beta [Desulfurobacterium pacificum]SMP10358.1 glycyl-tRNA synthetase beta chain [Desulfurobacterium pacificum]